MTSFTAPGKLYIAGEYGVVTPAQPAILTSVSQSIDASVHLHAEVDAQVRVHSAFFGKQPVQYVAPEVERAPGDREPVFRALDALSEYLDHPLPGMDIALESSLVNAGGVKFGFGSSGSVVVAVIGAASRALGCDLTPMELFRLSALAVIAGDERASCGDVATAVAGTWVYYRSFDRARANRIRYAEGIRAAMADGFTECEVQTLEPVPGWEVVVGHTGIPASTRDLVARVDRAADAGRFSREDFNHANAQAVERLYTAILSADAALAAHAIAEVRETLHRLDQAAGEGGKAAGIETAELGEMTLLAAAAGAEAKLSGAGGGDCAIALAPTAQIAQAVRTAWASAGYAVIPITGAQPGINDTKEQQ